MGRPASELHRCAWLPPPPTCTLCQDMCFASGTTSHWSHCNVCSMDVSGCPGCDQVVMAGSTENLAHTESLARRRRRRPPHSTAQHGCHHRQNAGVGVTFSTARRLHEARAVADGEPSWLAQRCLSRLQPPCAPPPARAPRSGPSAGRCKPPTRATGLYTICSGSVASEALHQPSQGGNLNQGSILCRQDVARHAPRL
jgi:hypothetical protein